MVRQAKEGYSTYDLRVWRASLSHALCQKLGDCVILQSLKVSLWGFSTALVVGIQIGYMLDVQKIWQLWNKRFSLNEHANLIQKLKRMEMWLTNFGSIFNISLQWKFAHSGCKQVPNCVGIRPKKGGIDCIIHNLPTSHSGTTSVLLSETAHHHHLWFESHMLLSN